MNCLYYSLFVAVLFCAATTSYAFCQHKSHYAANVPKYYIQRYNNRAATTILLSKNDDSGDDFDKLIQGLRKSDNNKSLQGFLDSLLEIPDSQLLAGDLLFILVINFLLQIANEVSEPSFWLSGGFSQPVTMPVTLLGVVVRDSKMSISWVLSALWNRGYSSSSVADDETAVKKTLQIWIDYFSIRIIMELGLSLLITHSAVGGWLLFREVWYTALVMTFFRICYGRYGMRF
mmetsp:Transcript_28913/g.41320  ORF Transcript_28913/g.41320 Transcript_28913/m.41320 type:complete len:232 (+) Transcript_28913:74-769(+)